MSWISFTTTGSALPSTPGKLRRARHGVGPSRAMEEARRDGLLWGVVAVALVIGALVWSAAIIARDIDHSLAETRRMHAQRAARMVDAYYAAPCIHIRDLPLQKAYRLEDIERLCINPLPTKKTGDRS